MLLQLSSSTPLERNKVLEVLAAAADTCVRTDEETMYLELVHEQNKKCQITLRDRRPQAPLGVQIENEVDICRTLWWLSSVCQIHTTPVKFTFQLKAQKTLNYQLRQHMFISTVSICL